jgi:hypothetical protein
VGTVANQKDAYEEDYEETYDLLRENDGDFGMSPMLSPLMASSTKPVVRHYIGRIVHTM